ncbi:MAG: hypothetical protein Q7V01_16825, partial [Vicinamibacterales bacterium]|nr:hypothetical protein [Vicinamibacterales bacterium]
MPSATPGLKTRGYVRCEPRVPSPESRASGLKPQAPSTMPRVKTTMPPIDEAFTIRTLQELVRINS